MNRTVLTERQENILASAMAMVAAAAQPSKRLPRERQHVYDEHVAGWFERTLKGTRTPEPATYDELLDLGQLLNKASVVAIETLDSTVVA